MKKVISYSLYGSHPRYLIGSLRNVEGQRLHYPGWVCRFYVDQETMEEHSLLMHTLDHAGAEVVPMIPGVPKMMQRFLVADDKDVERYLVRDCDSRLGPEEAAAVEEWIREDTILHTCRAHPAHARPINGGLWGMTPRRPNWEAPNMQQMIKDFLAVNKADPEGYSVDQSFLSTTVWAWARVSATQHDAVSRKAYIGSKPFPMKWKWPRFMGEVIEFDENGKEFPRHGDWESVPREECL